MAIVQAQKKLPPQKKLRQKQKRKQGRNRQRRNLAISQIRKCESFEAKILPPLFLSQRKMPLSMKGNKKAVFAQRYLLATQDGEQQCYLSNYVSSQATMGISEVYPAIVWQCKPPVVKWPVTVRHQQQSALTTHLCQDDPQRYVFSSPVPSPVICGKVGTKLCTLTTKDLQYEVNEMISRQLIPCLFASDPSISPY